VIGRLVLAGAVAAPFAVGLLLSRADAGDLEFRFEDPRIVESSGLVSQDGLFVTMNDSGDSGRVFAVDPATGETAGVTSWAGGATDLEGLAPAGDGRVWVGDTGDNTGSRDSVRLYRVPVGTGDQSVEPESWTLTYPGGARDAETLMADPVTGRVYVASKGIFGGTLYAVPADLGPGDNRLKAIGQVLPVATDGAFFPDGRHLVVRDYSRAVVYTFPGLEEVGAVRLPKQHQGEGIAVDAAGSVFVSTEGQHAPVLRVPLPSELRGIVTPRPEASPGPGDGASEAPDVASPTATGSPDATRWTWQGRPWWTYAVVGWVALLVLVVIGRGIRRLRR
jgi:DNA-binding beta-propeller fold protein YncE